MGVLSRLGRLASLASQRSDIVVAVFMMLAVVMIVVPIPTFVLDALIALNMALSLLTLIVAFYVANPVDFSALPPIILLGTLFRLALSISITRLILLDGDAGHIVASFGKFVIGGEVVVGLVVFLIITIAQFIVITKGSERVAEVAARFTLDAMPGKQMAIDNDLRSGDIKQDEARARRARLERESQLYGAMDGAMKFVKGDAIAGVVIVFVNLVGGLMIGMLRDGMGFAEASHTYSLLTVGDGLIAQIPALLIALAAGTIVTRVASDVEGDLGSEIVRQLGANERALALSGVILFAAAFVPGFPSPVFLALAAALGGFALLLRRRRRGGAAVGKARDGGEASTIPDASGEPALLASDGRVWSSGPNTRHRLAAFVGADLLERIEADAFREEADKARLAIQNELGIEIPAVEMRPDPATAPHDFRIDFESVPVLGGAIPPGALLLADDPAHLDLLGVDGETGPPLAGRGPSTWVDEAHRDALRHAGIGFREPAGVLADCFNEVLRRYAAQFVGIQETRELLNGMESDHSELVKEVLRVLPLQKLCDVLRRLIEEEVPLRSFRAVLETLAEGGQRESDPAVLAEQVRVALARQICHRHAALDRVIAAYVLSRPTEEAVGAAIRNARSGAAPADEVTRFVVDRMRRALAEAEVGSPAVVVVSPDIRRALRALLLRNDIRVPVLSFAEIAPDFSVQSIALVALPAAPHPRLRVGSAPARVAETAFHGPA